MTLTFAKSDPSSGTPRIRLHVCEKFAEDRPIGVGGEDGQTHKHINTQTHLKF
jgi:hypothetical protein